MTRHLCALLCALAVAAAVSSPAFSQIPSFRGYTGLMIIPTGDALAQGEWSAGVFFEDVASGTVNDYVLNYGIIENLEVGFNRFRADSDSDGRTLLNAKFEFLSETVARPAVAVGVADITDDLDVSVYVAGSKTIFGQLGTFEGEVITPRIHAGFGSGMFDGLFAGLSTWLGNRFQVMAEWDSRNVQVGGRYRLTPNFTVHFGGFNLTDREGSTTSPRDSAAFGVGISFISGF